MDTERTFTIDLDSDTLAADLAAHGVPCQYAAAHRSNFPPVPAETVIECGPVGLIPACQRCADFYDRMSAPRV